PDLRAHRRTHHPPETAVGGRRGVLARPCRAGRVQAGGGLMRFVVTGSGRCGTHYLATLLTEAGVKCTHETVYSYLPEPKPWTDQVADSSLMAAPYLGEYPTVLLVRHPLKVVKSWV